MGQASHDVALGSVRMYAAQLLRLRSYHTGTLNDWACRNNLGWIELMEIEQLAQVGGISSGGTHSKHLGGFNIPHQEDPTFVNRPCM